MDPAQYPQHEIDSTQHQHYPELDIDTILSARMDDMRLKYQAELDAFKSSLESQFTAATQQSHVENGLLLEELTRLRGIERAAMEPDIEMAEVHKRTRDPRPRPRPAQPTTKDPRTVPKPASPGTRITVPTPVAPTTPRRSSGASSRSKSTPEVHRLSPNQPQVPPSMSAPEVPCSSPGALSTPSPQTKNKKRPGEYQLFAADIEKDAQTFKTTFQYHIRFIWGCLDAARAPSSASPEAVKEFVLQFQHMDMKDLSTTGQSGRNIIDPTGIKIGVSIQEAILTKNKILSAFFKLEESALLHVSSYLAKLGIAVWAPDFSQTVYSLYNMAMRMCAIDTFRFLVAGRHYDFLRPNGSFVNDSNLLTRIYDHFVHHYMFNKWKVEIRTPGGNENAAERNRGIQGRIRLHESRVTYLEGAGAPGRVRLMFAVKATSDDESTPRGPRVLAREERSADADQLIRTVDKLIVQDLIEAGKKGPAKNRLRRVAPSVIERNPSLFPEIPKEMPIQYYDATWFNNRSPHDRAKLGAKLIVALVPNSAAFFSGRGDDALSVEALTEKYGPEVFKNYALDYPTDYPTAVKATSGTKSGRAGDPASDDDGESVGSRDSTDESDGASAGSFIENDEGVDDYDEQAFRPEGEIVTNSYDMDLEAEIFDGPDSDDELITKVGSATNPTTLSDGAPDVEEMEATEVTERKVGDHYPPDDLPDHRGPYFAHDKAKLVQRDYKDVDGNLIAPHELYSKLTEGTLVLVTVSLVTYVITNQKSEKGEAKADRKVYHVLVDRLKILDHGDGEAWNPPIPALPERRYYSPATPKRGRDVAAEMALLGNVSKAVQGLYLSRAVHPGSSQAARVLLNTGAASFSPGYLRSSSFIARRLANGLTAVTQMPPKRNPIWDYFVKGELQNSSHSKAYCRFCMKHHLGLNHPSNQGTVGMANLEWNEATFVQARADAGSVLGVKDSMIAHLIGANPCPYAMPEAQKHAKKIKNGKAPATDSADDGSDNEQPMKKRKLFCKVENLMKQTELQVFRGLNIPFNKDEVARIQQQFLRATVSANLLFRWTENPEIIKLMIMFRATACGVIPSREVISGRLLDAASAEVEKTLQGALKGQNVVLSTDSWKDDSRNSITGVNVVTSTHSYLVDLIKSNGHHKDGAAMCIAFEGMVDNTESKYGCIVVLFCCDNDGGSQRGWKDIGAKRTWIFVVPCGAHQGHLILGDYFTVNEDAAEIVEMATVLVGWILSHDRVCKIFDAAQYAKNFAILVYLVANLTCWTTHYLAFRRLLLLKVPLWYAAYLQHEEIVAAQVGAEKNAKAKAKMTAMANEQCDVIESNDFWTGLETLVDDIEPICYATNINQADRMRAEQVLLSFAGVFHHFQAHKNKVVSKGMCARIEKCWAALDQLFFTFCLILNPYEVLKRFGDKAGLNVFVLSAELMTLYRHVQSRPSTSPIVEGERESKERQVSEAFLHYLRGTGDFAPWEANKETFGRDNGNDPMKVWEQLKACPDIVELANFTLLLLGLVVNQASNKCSFSDLKIKKTRLRNRLGILKLEKMSKLGSSIRTEHLQEGLIDERKPRNVHEANKAASLISVPRYSDVLETADGDGEEETQLKLVKSAVSWRADVSKWKAASNKPADSDEGDTDDEELPTPGTRRPTKIFPRSLDLLFGGVVRRAVGKPPPAQFTREVLMMELLAAEESDEEPDDGALPGSEDEYTP
ncbi:hypothetical protein B0H10DRAFT_2435314 [Mycena sp. CBHHK59/15]|nr:hypothetical protein B0H10DRAFT_2435314 [Mycena sp. CBHHK59/15]